jgi:hypothetical protein
VADIDPKKAQTKALLALRDGAAEGYALMSKTGLDRETLADRLSELLAKAIVFLRGDLGPDRIGDAFVSLRPSARGYTDRSLSSS